MAVRVPWQCVAVLAVSLPFTLAACLAVLLALLPITAWHLLFHNDCTVPGLHVFNTSRKPGASPTIETAKSDGWRAASHAAQRWESLGWPPPQRDCFVLLAGSCVVCGRKLVE